MTRSTRTADLQARILSLETEVRQWEEKHETLSRKLGFLEAILANARLPAYMKDPDGRYLTVNREFERLSGVSLEFLRGKTDFEVFPEPVARLFREQDEAVTRAGSDLEFEETIPLPDGIHTFITAKFPHRDEKGEFAGVGGVCTDITRRKEMELQLAQDQERLAVTLRSLAEGVIATDGEGRVILMNRAAAAMTGVPEAEARGRPLANVLFLAPEGDGQHSETFLEDLLRDTSAEASLLLRPRIGSPRLIALTVAPMPTKGGGTTGRVLVLRDASERRRLERELLKSRKMESLQVIAGGIAHDFNNFLTSILGNLSLASVITRDDKGKVHQLLGGAERAALQARKLTQQLLTFAKGGEPVKTVASLPKVIRDSAGFLLRGGGTRCEYHIPEDLWDVEIDTGQMSQVIQNLINNAEHAMSGGGVIHIRCANVQAETGMLPGLPPGRYVQLAIEDSGTGIPEEIQERIFDPFFTTKPGGSGLGLAITHSIVARHGGMVGMRSTPGQGSAFVIHLPAASGPTARKAPGQQGSPQAAPPSELPSKPRRKILIMDDDELLRMTLQEILGFLNYEVVACSHGEEVLRLYESHHREGTPFDAVIMDLTIPGAMGGKEAVRHLLKIEPGAKVIVSSGFSNDPIMSHFSEYGFTGVLVKPYRIQDLETLLERTFSAS